MNLVIMITLAVIAGCFIVALIFLIPLLIEARRASHNISQLAKMGTEELTPIIKEMREATWEIKMIAKDIRGGVSATTALWDTVRGITERLTHLGKALGDTTGRVMTITTAAIGVGKLIWNFIVEMRRRRAESVDMEEVSEPSHPQPMREDRTEE